MFYNKCEEQSSNGHASLIGKSFLNE